MSRERRPNRGPSAAAENRSALVAAARRVFADGGLEAPLSAVAKTAGVGQGSLYRHFPDRIALALAVFEDNVVELERLASDPSVTLGDLLAFLTQRSIDSVAFIDMIATTTEDARLTGVNERVTAALASKLPSAQSREEVAADVSADDLFLAVGMIATFIARTPASERRAVADRAWSLVWRGLGSSGA